MGNSRVALGWAAAWWAAAALTAWWDEIGLKNSMSNFRSRRSHADGCQNPSCCKRHTKCGASCPSFHKTRPQRGAHQKKVPGYMRGGELRAHNSAITTKPRRACKRLSAASCNCKPPQSIALPVTSRLRLALHCADEQLFRIIMSAAWCPLFEPTVSGSSRAAFDLHGGSRPGGLAELETIRALEVRLSAPQDGTCGFLAVG